MSAGIWWRVFGASETMPQPGAIQTELARIGHDVPLHVRGDDLGWTSIDIPIDPPLQVERYLTEEDNLRRDLDAWAALAETWGASAALMTRLVTSRQLFTIHQRDESSPVADAIARQLARIADGVISVDGRGFLDPDGALILAES